ncbi:hypothetical protein P8C59_007183 [Phyllachora maydis]|uniref:Uncharacterized protein n=1 Tax=Phyllachora maydis TaxID=1825666 RepID=A0AAD9I8C5_9PEZI|nr:hypothetical protein P8C59_007183 [Phyllachora maydis]
MYMYIACLPYYYYCYNSLFTNLLIANVDSFSNLDNSVYTILAACKAKWRESAKAYAMRSKRTAGGNAGRYTTNSGLTANKDDNDAYNGAYMPSADAEEEKGSSGDDDVNSGTSDSADKGKGSGAYKRGKGALRCKDTLLYK